MKSLKKLFSLIFAILITVTAIPFYGLNVSAESILISGNCGVNGDNVTWLLYSRGKLVISGTGYMKNYDTSDNPAPWRGENITSVVIKNGVKNIGNYAFMYHNLNSVTIPPSVTDIGKNAFFRCEQLTTVKMSNGLTEIGDYAFYDCDRLVSVTIPDSVTSIGTRAFQGCRSLVSVTIPKGITEIGYGIFYACSRLASVTIPDGVTIINGWAFDGCSSLVYIIIPESVKIIGDQAFPRQLTDVYYYGNEEQWQQIEISDYNDFITITNANIHCNFNGKTPFVTWMFDGESTLTISGTGDMRNYQEENYDAVPWYKACPYIKTVVIENGVTGIGSYAFDYCYSLTSVTIPENVKSIGDQAFPRQLTDVYYYGTEEQWQQIEISSNNDFITNANIHYNFVIRGDLNGDGKVNDKDALRLLYHAMFPSESKYSINQNGDMNGDGKVNDKDALRLLYHIMFPANESYMIT